MNRKGRTTIAKNLEKICQVIVIVLLVHYPNLMEKALFKADRYHPYKHQIDYILNKQGVSNQEI